MSLQRLPSREGIDAVTHAVPAEGSLTRTLAVLKVPFILAAIWKFQMNNFVTGVHVTPGNVHDSVAFDPLYDDVCKHYPEHKIVAADSAYKTPWICKRILRAAGF